MNLFISVVLYNPDSVVWDNILSYSNMADILYLIDNSTKPIEWIDQINYHSNIKYISMHGNQGIATALNTGAYQAMYNGLIN